MRKIIFICFLFLGGCASTMQAHLDDVQNNFSNAKFEIESTDPKDQNNLDLLINGIALFHDNKFQESDAVFQEFNTRNINETSTSVSREATGLLFGQGANSYKPYMMDSLFVSYYQIWDLLALNDWANARVVINQSYARQQNMSIEYEKLIEENKDKINTPELSEFIDKNTGDWLAFREIMNPALMYLSGIYFLNDGDFENAATYLKRANGMMPDNSFIKQDLQYALQKKRPTNTTWKFIETGFAPRLHENDAGIFLPQIGMIYFTFSQPYFDNNFTTPKNAEMLANVDAMFMTEYNEYRTNEILRAYTSAISKTALQTSLYNSNSQNAQLFGILSSVYTVSSSHADVRTWATLPKYIYVIREKSENDNQLVYERLLNGIVDKKIIKLK